jgi:hypothetical protein
VCAVRKGLTMTGIRPARREQGRRRQGQRQRRVASTHYLREVYTHKRERKHADTHKGWSSSRGSATLGYLSIAAAI